MYLSSLPLCTHYYTQRQHIFLRTKKNVYSAKHEHIYLYTRVRAHTHTHTLKCRRIFPHQMQLSFTNLWLKFFELLFAFSIFKYIYIFIYRYVGFFKIHFLSVFLHISCKFSIFIFTFLAFLNKLDIFQEYFEIF